MNAFLGNAKRHFERVETAHAEPDIGCEPEANRRATSLPVAEDIEAMEAVIIAETHARRVGCVLVPRELAERLLQICHDTARDGRA